MQDGDDGAISRAKIGGYHTSVFLTASLNFYQFLLPLSQYRLLIGNPEPDQLLKSFLN